MNLIFEFIEFLHREDIYEDYKRNMRNGRWFEHIQEKTCPPDEFMGYSFVWSETPEGRPFWNKMDNKWLETLTQLRKENCSICSMD